MAHPSQWGPGEESERHRENLRDHFAIAALMGLMANKERNALFFAPEQDAVYCWRIADEMLKARGGGSPE